MRLLLASLLFVPLLLQEGLPPGVKDTQNPKDIPPTPQEAVKRFKLPEGFNVTLFAGEPQVCQPISLTFDDRGRLWVAECYSYPAWMKDAPKEKDRILILEDTDGDGQHDKRTVFYDKADNLTSIVIGHGGVWAMCTPNLLFIPDKNGDGVADGKPQIVLDGFSEKLRHNLPTGLTWGPDGWLYACHGIIAESRPGVPGTPEDKRMRINCGVWRYHPTRKIVEAVCHGTTNPWGLDFDANGEGFFTNCVIGHLWHMIPGAHYKRMYGQDYNKYAYELIDQTAEHLHWAGGNWTESRGGKGAHSDAGGGHAHTGCMVYLGDNFPAEYRNNIFMCNLHGNRLNIDRHERKGNSYTAKRGPDFLTSDNEWFRGTAMAYGPDGAVYVADWCDLGECHDHDGTHRSSGRIYRVVYGKPDLLKPFDLRKQKDDELIALLSHRNEWYARRAAVLLAERGSPANDKLQPALRKAYDGAKNPHHQLRISFTLHALDYLGPIDFYDMIGHQDEHIRSWTIRFLSEQRTPYPLLPQYLSRRAEDQSGLVRLHVASASQRLAPKDRLTIAAKLLTHANDANDRCQPLMIWYGIEEAVVAHPEEGVKLALDAKIPKIRQFIARRLADTGKEENVALVVKAATSSQNADVQRDLLQGLRDGLKGSRSTTMPKGWSDLYPQLASSKSKEVRRMGALLALQFDDAGAGTTLRKQMMDVAQSTEDREIALQALVEKGVPDLVPQLVKLLDDKALRSPVLRSLAAYRDDRIPKEILRVYPTLSDGEKQEAIGTLASRKEYALVLLDAIEQKKVARTDVTAFTARQLLDLKNKDITSRLEKVWGSVRSTPGDRKATMEKYKKLLTPDVMAKANPSAGRVVFNKTCAQCHLLFGEGHKIGPDLTGSQRHNLDYILENSVDPSAVIGSDYRLTIISTTKGRFLSGIIVEETERALTIQTATDKVLVPKNEIEERAQSPVSMMPEGQFEKLTPDELRDLVVYLACKTQVSLPK